MDGLQERKEQQSPATPADGRLRERVEETPKTIPMDFDIIRRRRHEVERHAMNLDNQMSTLKALLPNYQQPKETPPSTLRKPFLNISPLSDDIRGDVSDDEDLSASASDKENNPSLASPDRVHSPTNQDRKKPRGGRGIFRPPSSKSPQPRSVSPSRSPATPATQRHSTEPGGLFGAYDSTPEGYNSTPQGYDSTPPAARHSVESEASPAEEFPQSHPTPRSNDSDDSESSAEEDSDMNNVRTSLAMWQKDASEDEDNFTFPVSLQSQEEDNTQSTEPTESSGPNPDRSLRWLLSQTSIPIPTPRGAKQTPLTVDTSGSSVLLEDRSHLITPDNPLVKELSLSPDHKPQPIAITMSQVSELHTPHAELPEADPGKDMPAESALPDESAPPAGTQAADDSSASPASETLVVDGFAPEGINHTGDAASVLRKAAIVLSHTDRQLKESAAADSPADKTEYLAVFDLPRETTAPQQAQVQVPPLRGLGNALDVAGDALGPTEMFFASQGTGRGTSMEKTHLSAYRDGPSQRQSTSGTSTLSVHQQLTVPVSQENGIMKESPASNAAATTAPTIGESITVQQVEIEPNDAVQVSMSKTRARRTLIDLLATPFKQHREYAVQEAAQRADRRARFWAVFFAAFIQLLLIVGSVGLAYCLPSFPMWIPYSVENDSLVDWRPQVSQAAIFKPQSSLLQSEQSSLSSLRLNLIEKYIPWTHSRVVEEQYAKLAQDPSQHDDSPVPKPQDGAVDDSPAPQGAAPSGGVSDLYGSGFEAADSAQHNPALADSAHRNSLLTPLQNTEQQPPEPAPALEEAAFVVSAQSALGSRIRALGPAIKLNPRQLSVAVVLGSTLASIASATIAYLIFNALRSQPAEWQDIAEDPDAGYDSDSVVSEPSRSASLSRSISRVTRSISQALQEGPDENEVRGGEDEVETESPRRTVSATISKSVQSLAKSAQKSVKSGAGRVSSIAKSLSGSQVQEVDDFDEEVNSSSPARRVTRSAMKRAPPRRRRPETIPEESQQEVSQTTSVRRSSRLRH